MKPLHLSTLLLARRVVGRLHPHSLAGQLLAGLSLAVFATVIAVQLIMVPLTHEHMFRHMPAPSNAANHLAAVIGTLNATPAESRSRLLSVLNEPHIRLSLDIPWQHAIEPEEAASFHHRLAESLQQPLTFQLLSVMAGAAHGPVFAPSLVPSSYSMRAGDWRVPGSSLQMVERRAESFASRVTSHFLPLTDNLPNMADNLLLVTGQVRLDDGSVLTFREGWPGARSVVLDTWPENGAASATEHEAAFHNAEETGWGIFASRVLVLVCFSLLGAALMAAWAARRLTRPLATLTQALTNASGTLVQNSARTPLATLSESGPLEVARALRAFNHMQGTVKRRFDARSEALAGISHDLRLPLTRLRLRIEQIDDDALRSNIEADLQEMNKLIKHALEFVRVGDTSEKALALDFNHLLLGVVEDMRLLGAQIMVDGSSSQLVHARPDALRRCLMNIIENSRRYAATPINIRVDQSRSGLTIVIEDSGPGIPESEFERVFAPYVRLPKNCKTGTHEAEGNGLGLAIARDIARLHGGDITLANRPGGGLAVTVSLASQ